jgi:hypothetical protein
MVWIARRDKPGLILEPEKNSTVSEAIDLTD